MIDLCDKNIQWTERADDEMGLLTMIDELYNGTIVIKFEENYLKYEPRNKIEKSQKDYLLFHTFYSRHHTLLNDIVEIFFPTLVFIPSKININSSSEFFLFMVINDIYNITWYQEIENSRPRGYEKEKKELYKALYIVKKYADYNKVTKHIDFPKHKNETLLSLSKFLKKYRPRQENKIIKAIKEYFNIKSLKDTKDMKIIKGNIKMIKTLEKRGLLCPLNVNTCF